MRVGIDFGGTKIAGILINEAGETLSQARVPTPGKDYAASLAAIQTLVSQLESEAGITASSIGIGVPGSVGKATDLISGGHQTGLPGHRLGHDLEALLNRPVKVANDANCFALSEAVNGAGKGAEVVFGVILGTGVGGGIVVNGKLLVGANAITGEWGHIPLPDPTDDERPGPACNCGRFGHIESWLSGPALVADYARAAGIAPENAPLPAEIVTLAEDNAIAEEALCRYEERLARALAVIVNSLDPDVIVLGGGVSNIDRLYHSVPVLIRPHLYCDTFKTRLVRNQHGDNSGVRGAAWL